uniref:Uncharacterized protein n=1 Tax=Monopterus albus TaxID=43700 RepID=A0A3Q3IAH0_MONAL
DLNLAYKRGRVCHMAKEMVAAVLLEASPVCHCASCRQDGGGVHLSVWPSAGPDYSARCSTLEQQPGGHR